MLVFFGKYILKHKTFTRNVSEGLTLHFDVVSSMIKGNIYNKNRIMNSKSKTWARVVV